MLNLDDIRGRVTQINEQLAGDLQSEKRQSLEGEKTQLLVEQWVIMEKWRRIYMRHRELR